MNFTASLNGSVATLVAHSINNRADIKVHNAANLADELLAFVSDPNAPAVDTSGYRIDAFATGLRISTAIGSFDLPWRWIATIGNALNA